MGFGKLYRRVQRIATGAIAKKTCADTREIPIPVVSGHAWGSFSPDEGIGTALVVMGIQCPPPSLPGKLDHDEPTEYALLSPGGATLEELKLLSPQSAEEIFNEFDFTKPSDHDPITLSYGERFSGPNLEFRTIRAASRTNGGALSFDFEQRWGSAFGPPQGLTQAMVLAKENFATVHICFVR